MAVYGGKKVVAELQKLDRKVRGRNLDEAVRESAKLVLEQAQVNARIKAYDTGRYYRSLFWTKNSQKSTDQNSNYLVTYDAGRSRYDLTGAYYGAILEYRHDILFDALVSMQFKVPEVVSKRIAVKMNIRKADLISN